MIFVTSYLKEDGLYADYVQAQSWDEAEQKVINRGLGETVDGIVDTISSQCSQTFLRLQDKRIEMNNLQLMPLRFSRWMLHKSISIHLYCLDKLSKYLLP
jgi:hypothetical protein